MRAIGFIKKHDSGKVLEEFLDCTTNDEWSKLTSTEKSNVIAYLKSGQRIFALLLYLFDDEIPIGPYTVYTDGFWIWPGHYIYYLIRGEQVMLYPEFVKYLQAKDYQMHELNQDNKKSVMNFFYYEMLKDKPPKFG